jgi:glutamyl/glutaminyl-tRNA synthetase
MPTIKGLRRRGYTADALNAFCTDIGVSRNDNTIEVTVQCKHTYSLFRHTRTVRYTYIAVVYVM